MVSRTCANIGKYLIIDHWQTTLSDSKGPIWGTSCFGLIRHPAVIFQLPQSHGPRSSGGHYQLSTAVDSLKDSFPHAIGNVVFVLGNSLRCADHEAEVQPPRLPGQTILRSLAGDYPRQARTGAFIDSFGVCRSWVTKGRAMMVTSRSKCGRSSGCAYIRSFSGLRFEPTVFTRIGTGLFRGRIPLSLCPIKPR